MRGKLALVSVALFALTIGIVSAGSSEIHIWVGKKALNEGDWSVLDHQTEFGLTSSWNRDWPVHIAADILYATDSTTTEDVLNPGSTIETTVSFIEICGGVRKIWGKRVRPYLGGGLTLISGKVESRRSDSDQSLGFWVNAGLDFKVTKLISLGLDARLSRAEITLFDGFASKGIDAEAGGEHFGVMLGFHF